jgi:hypothetical protein
MCFVPISANKTKRGLQVDREMVKASLSAYWARVKSIFRRNNMDNIREYLQFEKDHETLRHDLVRQLDPQREERPHLLFHYTSTQALISIVQNNTLWATNILYMNDFGELHYSRLLIDDIIRQRMAAETSPPVQQFFARIHHTIDALTELFDTYAVCFCEEKNQLAQWREYGHRGGGYAIGLDPQKIEPELHTTDGEVVVLFKVCYEAAEQRALTSKLLDIFCAAVTSDLKNVEPNVWARVLPHFERLFAGRIIPYLVSFKHEAFKVEQEWRAVVFGRRLNPGVQKFRDAGGFIAPYKEISSKAKLPIKIVVQGPHIEPELGKHSVNALLMQAGFTDVQVFPSGITLRKA